MLKIVQKQLPIDLTEENTSHIQRSLQARYNSLLHRVRQEYLNCLSLGPEFYPLTAPPKDAELLLGELFMPENGTIFYIKVVKGSGILEAGVFTEDHTRDCEEFFSEIRDIICEVSNDVKNWEVPQGYAPLEVDDAQKNVTKASPEQLAAARAIVDKTSRDLLEKIEKAGSIFLNKIETEDRQDTEKRIHQFRDLKLVNMDYAVLCRSTGQQILRVSDKATLDDSSQKAFKCFICGNPISEELVEEVLTCTESCRDLLKEQNWLLILVKGILNDLGIDEKQLQIYQQQDLPLQIFLSLNGLRYLLVLCTSALSLDQAYLISAHLSAYQLDHAVIISTEKISTLMRHHLGKTNTDTQFHFIDNLCNLDAKVQKTLLDQQRVFLHNKLVDIASITPVNVADLVLRRMVPQIAEEKPEAKPEVKVEAKAEEKPEVKAEAKPEVKAEEKPEVKAEVKVEEKPEVKVEDKSSNKDNKPSGKDIGKGKLNFKKK